MKKLLKYQNLLDNLDRNKWIKVYLLKFSDDKIRFILDTKINLVLNVYYCNVRP